MRHNELLMEKIRESLRATLPITAIVLVLAVTIAPLTPGTLVLFLFGALLLVVGMGLFTLGVDMSMIPMGDGIGVAISRAKKIAPPLLVCLILGIVVTVAEPDLQVLAEQLPTVPNLTLILAVALGVGVFLVLSQVRMLLHIPLSHTLVFFYVIVFILAYFAPNDFIPAAFDSGGVTTGPITVPFIMALGIGMAAIRSDKDSGSDSFGLVAMCSIGPVLSVLLLGIFMPDMDAAYTPVSIPVLDTTRDAALVFAKELPDYIGEVALALLPVVAVFGLFQLLFRRFHRRQLGKILVGLLYTYAGLVLFLVGVNVGFMPAGATIGASIASSRLKMATGAHWSTGWLLHRSGGTGSAGIGPPGGGNLRRFHYPVLDSLRAVHRHRSVCGAGNDTDFNGHQPHVVPDSGLCHLPEHDVFRAPDFHRRGLRLRRRGIRPHDHHVSPPLCHGGL